MIEFNYLTDFRLENESRIKNWILKIIKSEDREEGEIVYIFCDDNYLYKLNVEFYIVYSFLKYSQILLYYF